MNRRFLLVALLTLLIIPGILSAQDISASLGGLVLTPSSYNPTPGQTVTITAKSYSIDIDAANLVWTAGGKTIARGIGVTSAKVEAPKLGSRLTVDVSATTPDGASVSSTLVISSGVVDLILESDGYVPPFFRGKLAPVYQNTLKIIAVPHLANSSGVEYDPKSLVYQWQQEDKVLQSQSGYGRQSVTIPGAIVPRPYLLTVTVSTRDGGAQGSGAIVVEAGSPSLAFYRNDPLYGPLFNKAIGSTVYLGSQRESGVLAVPYGFNRSDSGLGGLLYSWLINGTERPELSSSQSVTLRSPASSAGTSNIELTVKGGKNILQQATGAFSTTWSQPSTNSRTTTTF